PYRARNLHDSGIGEKFGEITAYGARRRRVWRAEVHQQHAEAADAVVRKRWFRTIEAHAAKERARRSSVGELLRQGIRQQLGRDVDDRDHPLVRHSRGTNDAKGPEDLAIDFIWRRDDAAFVERRKTGFAADEKMHPLGALADVEQMQQRRLLLEDFEQAPQPLHVRREVFRMQKILLARHNQILAGPGEGGVARVDRGAHQSDYVFAQLAQ